jgi:C1A family cysteine protease
MSESTADWTHFNQFQETFQKKYNSIAELTERFRIFRDNLADIFKHNENPARNFTMGINAFTDLTSAEFKKQFASGYTRGSRHKCAPFSEDANYYVSESFDWRDEDVVNPVRDQGQCGSCWAFAATANAESAWAISTGNLVDLSEQYLVDCATGVGYFNLGCNGGMPDSAFEYLIHNGPCGEQTYPYVSGNTKTAGTCHECLPIDATFSECYDVPSKNQMALLNAVVQQPVVIAIEADTRYFQSYSSGILTDSIQCGTNLDHAVEIVGYGEEKGILYWTVRNSWGESWGENGYVRIQRSESTNDAGVCGVAVEPSFIQ